MADDGAGRMTAGAAAFRAAAGMPAEPVYPQLCLGLVVLPVDDGLVVEGGPSRQRFSGAAATAVLPGLLPLLDGCHTVPELAAKLGLPLAGVQRAISLLDASDLLEYGNGQPRDVPAAQRSVAVSLSRHVNVTRAHDSFQEILATLRDSSVLLAAEGQVAAAISDDLRGAGVGQVIRAAGPGHVTESGIQAAAAARRGLVVLQDAPAGGSSLDRVERLCRDHRVPLLRFASRGGRVEVGPLFYRDYTACATCFGRGYETADWNDLIPCPAGDGEYPAEHLDALAAGLATAEALAVLAQVTAPASFRFLTVTTVPELTQHRLVATPSAGCANCPGGMPAASGSPGAIADALEWLVQSPPAELWLPSADGAKSRRSDGSRGTALRQRFPTSPSRPLPKPPAALPADAVPGRYPAGTDGRLLGGRLDETIIAEILMRVCGCAVAGGTSGDGRRTLGDASPMPAEIYVLSQPGQFGDLPGTIFRYDEIDHGMIALRPDGVPMDQCLAGTGLVPGQTSLALIFVGAVGRISQIYGQAAYRLAHLDAGCAAAQLCAAADGHGLRVSFAPGWDDRLAELLDLPYGHEAITVVAAISPEGGRACH